eukprot:1179426-Prymnesium_polylepis.1
MDATCVRSANLRGSPLAATHNPPPRLGTCAAHLRLDTSMARSGDALDIGIMIIHAAVVSSLRGAAGCAAC